MYKDYFGEILTAMVTPFDDNGHIDWAALDALVEHLLATGTDTLVVTGSTGEAATLSMAEKIQIYGYVVNKVGDRAKVIAGTGTNDTQETIELSQRAQKLGVHGLMLVVPYYNKPPQDALYAHFSAVAAACDLPILVYNVPGRTACNLLPATVLRLAEIENIFGIKEASGNLDQVSEIAAAAPDDFVIYSGDDSLTLPILAVGGHGVVSVASHVIGRQLKEMVQAYKRGYIKQAQQIHAAIFPVCKAMFVTTNPVPLKAALNMIGINVGKPRLPLLPCPEQESFLIRQALVDFGLLSE
ncbi:MAG: 4-hydroxy-tetrahydrodipicolinate synthase [Firmicutes bacterium]|nr:4-hydroxy-tetrahydrodipicolinate synthase [Bacillota bacterium]